MRSFFSCSLFFVVVVVASVQMFSMSHVRLSCLSLVHNGGGLCCLALCLSLSLSVSVIFVNETLIFICTRNNS